MIWQLMKRDPAWRWTPALTLGSFAFCVVWHFLAAKGRLESNLVFVSVFSVLPIAAGHAVVTEQNETRFQATLPITIRQVYLSRALSMLGLLWLPVAVSAGVALALPNAAAPIANLVAFTSVLTLAMSGAQSAGARGAVLPISSISIAVFAWIMGASMAPIAGWGSEENRMVVIHFLILFCGLASIAIFRRTWQTLPGSFQIAPVQASPVTASSGVTSKSPMRNIPWLPVFRSAFRWNGAEFLYLFVVMLMGSLRPYILFFFAAAWPSARPRVRWLFALPVPRRALLAVILTPMLFNIAAGYLVSVHLPTFASPYLRGISVRASQGLPQWPHYRQDPACKTLNVLPSLEFWVPVKGGIAPLLQAPWGETFRPPVFHESGFDIFNPYAVGCGNSEGFLDWQFQRATVAIYGHPIPRKKDEGWYVVDSHVVVTSLRTQIVTVAAMTALGMIAMIGGMMNDWHRFRRLGRPVRVVILSVLAVAGFALVLLDAGDKLVLTQWISWALPSNLGGAVAVAVPVLAILYWVLDSVFLRVELVDRPEAANG
jgi:hypothetical protein